ncbi:LysM peptidoglycan-binding domain-containing protein [Streptomyces chartreusis]
MPHSPTAPSLAVRLVRAVGSLLALAALLAGVPALLLVAGTLPDHVPSPGEIGTVLTAPDSGSGLFTVLTVAAWVLWAWFCCATLVEIASMARHRPTLRVRGFGAPQRLAAFLLGGLLVLPAGTAMAASTPAAAVTAPQLPQQTAISADAAAAAAQQSTPASVAYVVNDTAETVWSIAEGTLGDGQRFAEIRELNPDLPKTTILPRGTVVRLPSDARVPEQAAASTVDGNDASTQLSRDDQAEGRIPDSAAGGTTAGAERKEGGTREYVVQPADNLTKIAKDELGDADRWHEVFEENKGEAQPHGHTFTNPDLIYPGQELTLPGQQSGAGPSGEQDTARPGDEEPQAPDAPAPEVEGSDEGASAGAAAGADQSSPTAEQDTRDKETSAPSSQPADAGASTSTSPSSYSPVPEQPSETAAPPETSEASPSAGASSAAAVDEAQHDDSGDMSLVGVAGLAASGVLAAAVLGTIGFRRLLRRRELRRGYRIAMPTGRAAATELALRSVDASIELNSLDAMLRTMAVHLARQEDSVLPELAAVRLGEAGALLHLNESAQPLAPFTTADGSASSNVWWCSATTDQLLGGEELRQVDPPYPGLLALGSGDDQSIVLVDLERIGAIHLTGSRRLDVLRMAAVMLALSPLGGQIELAVAGEATAPGLTTLDQQRVTPHPGLAEALQALASHQAEQQRTLAEFPAGLPAARLEEDVEELWPLVLLANLDACPDPEGIGRVWELVDRQPYAALATFTSSATPVEASQDVWVVDTDAATVTVPDTTWQCTVSGCTEEEYADTLDLVLTADLPLQPDVPSRPIVPTEPAATVGTAELEDDKDSDNDIFLLKSAPGSVSPTAVSPDSISPLAAIADLDDEDSAEEMSSDGPSIAPATGPVDGHGPSPVDAQPEVGPEGGRPSEAAAAGDPAPPAPAAFNRIRPVPTAALPLPRVSMRLPQGAGGSEPSAHTAPAAPNGPFVRVLGPVALDEAHGDILSNRRTTALELAAWLVLHPGANAHQVDEVLAPHGRISRDTRNSRIRELRKWLGSNSDADGDLYLPHVASQPDKAFRLVGVGCDWITFQQLADDYSGDDTAREVRLKAALDLVQGRPFSGIPARRYVWAEDISQDIIKRIVHVADELAERRLQNGDGRSALWAANRGLHVARETEQLWRHRFRAHALLGEHSELESAIRDLEALLLELGCSMEEETDEVLRLLQAARR